jgi:hypothetical protein
MTTFGKMNVFGPRTGLFVGTLTAISMAGDFYLRNFHWASDLKPHRDEFRLYMVRYDRISKPAACTSTRPDTSWRKHTIFAPRNGAVLRARPVEDRPNWLQLPPGDFIESRVCDVELFDLIDPAAMPRPFSATWNVQYETKLLQQAQEREAKQTAAAAAAGKGSSKVVAATK